MEHSVAPYSLSLPILKHVLGLPVAFSDLEFTDPELHRNLQWLRWGGSVNQSGGFGGSVRARPRVEDAPAAWLALLKRHEMSTSVCFRVSALIARTAPSNS